MSPNGDDWYDPAQIKKGGPMEVKVPRIQELLERDGYLKNHEREIRRRWGDAAACVAAAAVDVSEAVSALGYGDCIVIVIKLRIDPVQVRQL